MKYTRTQIIANFKPMVKSLMLESNKSRLLSIESKTNTEKRMWEERLNEDERHLADCVFFLALALGETDKLASMKDIEYIYTLYHMRIDYTGFCNIEI